MWVSFLAYWRAVATNVKTTERLEAALSRLTRIVLILCAIALLWLPIVPLPTLLSLRVLPLGAVWFWSGAAVTTGGLLVAVCARRHLGRNWSQAVTVKEGHELITSGPYALVRHPIYTGVLLGFTGSAMGRGELRGLLALAIVLGAYWYKLRLEEKWMRAHFGEQYESYSRRVAALVPYLI